MAPGRNFDGTLQDEVRRRLALVDYQLAHDRQWVRGMLAAASLFGGSLLFSWTINRSQHIPDSPHGYWGIVVIVVFFAWASFKDRKAEPKLATRQRHLRGLLAALEVRE